MNIIRTIVITCIVLQCITGWSCGHAQEKIDQNKTFSDTTLVGTLNMGGNEPFSELRLYDTTGVVYTLTGDSTILQILRRHQGEVVSCRGVIRSKTNIKILAITSYNFIER